MRFANSSMFETIFEDPVSSAVAMELAKSAPGMLGLPEAMSAGEGGWGRYRVLKSHHHHHSMLGMNTIWSNLSLVLSAHLSSSMSHRRLSLKRLEANSGV